MEYNFITNIKSCVFDSIPTYFIFAKGVPNLLYYSHIPTGIIALLLGVFVFWNNRTLLGRVLFGISSVFFMWLLFNLILWVNIDSRAIMFFWSLFGILNSLLFVLCLYFVYVFINKKDIDWWLKLILAFIVLLFALFMKKNVTGFNITSCEAMEDKIYFYFSHISELLIALWILIYAIYKYQKVEVYMKKQIVYLITGIEFFLVSFFVTGFLASYLAEKGVSYAFEIEQYGLFGMTFFIIMLGYLIVKFKAFDIKMMAAEALVVGLVILLFSEFFFIGIENTTVTILISVTILLSTLFGIWLINSVRNEVKRKEELQAMSGKLSEANDQLRKLDNSKSEFISIASHQLRTPLTAIKGFVSLLLEGSYGVVDQKQQEVLNKVYTSNERLVNLVEDLLNVSRMESGRMEFKFAPWKVDAICQEVVDTFYPKSKDLGLYLEYKKPENELPEVMIDGTKVREVISNLVDNALKYTPKGGVSLRVELANSSKYQVESSKGNNVIRVTISDTGIGVPVTELPYLFAKFSRGKDISRLNTGGTGLGLYVGKSMIEQNGGKIWAESEGQGTGSRFIIEIPLQQSKELMERWG